MLIIARKQEQANLHAISHSICESHLPLFQTNSSLLEYWHVISWILSKGGATIQFPEKEEQEMKF